MFNLVDKVQLCNSIHKILSQRQHYFLKEILSDLTWFNYFSLIINPIKAGGSESMYSLGWGVPRPPPQKKALENSYRVKMHVSPVFQGQLIEKKIRSITFIV